MLSFIGLEHPSASKAGVVVNGLMPILVARFSFALLKQRIVRTKLLDIALIATANGLILVDGGLHHFVGVLYFLLAALCLATYTVFMRLWSIPTDVMICQYRGPIRSCFSRSGFSLRHWRFTMRAHLRFCCRSCIRGYW
jgi:drug/metabolite transporter (DMT)-like permease